MQYLQLVVRTPEKKNTKEIMVIYTETVKEVNLVKTVERIRYLEVIVKDETIKKLDEK